ncbi:ATP-binding protein [Arthrobacter globiformis]|uniref:ATP-binding protein n=1 Tax=Arthrobacter globiformis TaxID=1665 RepID=UPI002787C1DD|nr:LuxR C-terminal-related transcriptional regulator [Arthrobacter globiformis]MDQ0867444.1 putative ATPase/DNA-binding CsgD family transcriptional regulator [Arthrobacter globiformis]
MQRGLEIRRRSLRDAGVSKREVDVFWLVGERLRNREIAERLHLSERTVESHVSSLLRKLGLADRSSLIDAAQQMRVSSAALPLPMPLSSFVGRSEEVSELLDLVRRERLVTVIGPAGVGKTRLALQVAASSAGVPAILVDLATVTPGGNVERVFADALGMTAQGGPLRPQLLEAISAGEYWFLVDNCEHVAANATSLLTALLTRTTTLRILATSRGPLHIPGEVVYELMPLALPSPVGDHEELLSSPCGRLFVDRAGSSAPKFRLTTENSKDVVQLCVRLEGLPLAIELAASRIRAFSPREILDHLNDQLAALRQVDQDTPARYRTLREALQWSYELLDQKERILFERCSIFRAVFGYGTVLDTLCYPPFQPSEVAVLFPGLVDKSLISASRDGEYTEYRMLDSVRQFAFSLLVQRGESDFLQGHYARHLFHRAASLLQDLQGGDQIFALKWFNQNWIDVRSCMEWSLEHEHHELAWEFLAGVGTGWEILGAKGELFDWLDVLLKSGVPDGTLGVKAEITAAVLLDYQDTAQALVHAQRARKAATELGDEGSTALAEWSLGWVTKYEDQASATKHLRIADQLFLQLGDEWHHALVLETLGCAENDTESAVELLMQGAQLFGDLHDYVKRANCLWRMANRAIRDGTRANDARQWLDEAERLAYRTGNRHEQLHAELFRIRLDQYHTLDSEHGPRLDQLLNDFRILGDQRCMCRCLLSLGYESIHSGNFRSADRQLADSVRLAARQF